MSHQRLYLHRKTMSHPLNENKTVEVNNQVIIEKNDIIPFEEQLK